MRQFANRIHLFATAPRAGMRIIVLAVFGAALLTPVAWAGSSNEVLGEVQLKAASKLEKSAGVWVDGQYLGYLKELRGSKKILLLPGRHELVARLTGHLDFETTVDVKAGDKKVVHVAMRENPDTRYPDPEEMAKIKVLVEPSRAAVFVNQRYVGHVDEFRGFRKFLGLAPGTYRIHIALPGYQSFDTEMTLLKRQKYEIKTELMKADPRQASELMTRPPAKPEKIADTKP